MTSLVGQSMNAKANPPNFPVASGARPPASPRDPRRLNANPPEPAAITQQVTTDPTDDLEPSEESRASGAVEKRDPVESLAEAYVSQLRQGDAPPVEELAAEHPDQEESILALFPAIRALERLRQRHDEDRSFANPWPTLERLGDFRIVREIGRGGMGVVFEAEQESLGRRVAVKVLPRAALLEEPQLRRFQREARTAASLHHTNIVPILGVGEQDGWHYYVMQLIDGVGLDTHLRRRAAGPGPVADRLTTASESPPNMSAEDAVTLTAPGPSPEEAVPAPFSGLQSGKRTARKPRAAKSAFAPREVARLGIQAAEALHYAHVRGVLHRDVKPANLLLDNQGMLWIADFGLARPLAEEEATRTGHAAGTLRYMAPEQFQGHTDVRSDIYSLGLTLYELLTGQPAFQDPQFREPRVGRGNGIVPVAPRSLYPSIPRDLETVVLKAMAEEPDHRYTTAAELAADLRRFLEDRPILARRASPLERLMRWARRNPALAASAAAVLALLIIVAVISTSAYFGIQRSFRAETAARSSAEASAKLAADALNQIFNRFAANRPGNDGEVGEFLEPASQPVLSREAADLLEELLAYYDRLGEQSAADPRLFWRAAEARRQVGDIHQQLGQFEQAVLAYDKAREQYAQAESRVGTAMGPTPLAWRLARARVQNGLGTAELVLGRTEEARNSFQETLDQLLAAPADLQSEPALRCELARTHYLLARRVLPGMGPRAMPPPISDETRPRFGDFPPPRDAPPDHHRPPPPPRQRESAHRPNPVAQQHLQDAIALLTKLTEEHATVPGYRLLLAACYREQASDQLADRSDQDVAAERRALSLLRELVAQYPDVPTYRYELVQTYAEISVFGDAMNRPIYQEAAERLRTGLEQAEELVAQHPNVADFSIATSHCCFKLGVVYERMSMEADDRDSRARFAEFSEQSYRKAVTRYTALVKQVPQATAHAAWLALFHQRLGVVLRHENRLDDSQLQLSRAVRGLNGILERDSQQPGVARQLSSAYQDQALTLRLKGDHELAREAAEASSRWARVALPAGDAQSIHTTGTPPPPPPRHFPPPPPRRRER